MKSIRRTFALLMALVLLLGAAPMGITAHAADTVSFTMEGYYDYTRSTTLGTMVKEQFNLADMELDGSLTDSAMTRAAEIFACATDDRPDGTSWKSVLEEPFASGKGRQFYTFADSSEEAFNNIFGSTSLEGSAYKSVGVGCFSQKESTKAWVVFVSFEDAETTPPSNLIAKKDVTINILPDNIGADLLHHYFSNAYCACYLIQGTTIGTALQLVNRYHSTLKIIPSEIDYAYTATNANVFSVDNDAHTITAVAPGTAKLGITIDGSPVPMFFNDRDVEVFETPVLTYEQTDDCISVYYGDFPVSAMNDIQMYMKGTKDELWAMCNIEADKTYEHYDYDPTETYTYVVRYWDDYLNGWVNIGEPLVLQLGDTPAVTPTPTPTPTPAPTPDTLWLPTEADLPNRTSEPTVDEVTAELEHIFTQIYPWGFEWHEPNASSWKQPVYSWQGGANLREGEGDAALAMAVSDLVFGKLPAKAVTDMSAADLRPGDIIITKNYEWHIVLDAAPQYVETASTALSVSSGLQEYYVRSFLYPLEVMDSNIDYVLTRYTSDSPGVDALHPSIVPADAEIIASQAISTSSYAGYESALEWTLTADGTLYLEGCGIPGYGDDGWKTYKDQIKRVVFGEGVTGVYQEIFSGYEALEEVIFSDTVNEIRRSTFINCSNLKHIEFGTGLKTIGENAFQHSGIESLVLPEGLESIGSYAFSGCANLKSLTVPASVTQWGNNVFTSCDALEELILEDGLTTLGYSAFNHLDNLKTVNIPGSLKTIPKMAFYFSDIETLNIAEGVEVIEDESFAYCKQLKEIHLPNTITEIMDDAFRDCNSVETIYFYGTEAQWNGIEIGTSNDCLTGGWWGSPNIQFADENGCFHKNTAVVSAVLPTCSESGLTEGLVCADCGKVLTERKVIPATDDHSYRSGKCTVCGKADPDYVPVTPTPTITPTVTPTVTPTPPPTVTPTPEVKPGINGTIGTNCTWSFNEETATLTISGEGKMGGYMLNVNAKKTDAPWFGGHGSVNTGYGDFSSKIHEIVLEDGITGIGPAAFAGLKYVHTVTLPSTLESIDDNVFAYCSRLTNITLPEGLTELGSNAFEGCGLQEITIPGTVQEIPFAAFFDCGGLQFVTIEEGVTTIGTNAFSKNYVLTELNLPATLTTIKGSDTFYGANNLMQVNFGGTREVWKAVEMSDSVRTQLEAVIHYGDIVPETPPAPIENPFTDVGDGDWYYTPVMWAVNEGVTGGKTPNSFAPNDSCTRAQVVTFLYAAAGKPAVKTADNPFTDVSESDWFYAPVMWAVENGITGGKTPTSFAPNETCTRAQVVTFLYAAADKPAVEVYSPFTDVADTDWYAAPVIWAVENGITGGTSPTTFGPNNDCTRAAVVTFLYANAGKPAIK